MNKYSFLLLLVFVFAVSCQKERCSLPIERGPCLAYMPRFGYNSTTRKCEEFIYGGCRGNANQFLNKCNCVEACYD